MRKIAGRTGETLVETLVGLLIGSIALLTLVSMMAASVKLIDKGETMMDGYMAEAQRMVKLDARSADGTGTLEFSSASSNNASQIIRRISAADVTALDTSGAYDVYKIVWYENQSSGDVVSRVISYQIQK